MLTLAKQTQKLAQQIKKLSHRLATTKKLQAKQNLAVNTVTQKKTLT